eukprot:2740361-Pleurochrysis_carterae.AAC.1
MVAGGVSLPGGIAAWLPSVCFIIISCHLEARRLTKQGKRVSPEVEAFVDSGHGAAASGARRSSREGYNFD